MKDITTEFWQLLACTVYRFTSTKNCLFSTLNVAEGISKFVYRLYCTLEKRLDQNRVMDPCMADVFVFMGVLCGKSCIDSL